METTMADSLPLRDALARYFADNGFGADGGYSAAWVDLAIGPVPFPFPNTAARKRAVPFHDLHHIVTGYHTDFRGECEISAWEVGAGCKREIVAWQLDLSLVALGVVIAPRRTFRAFRAGRGHDSLYGRDYPSLVSLTVGEARALCATGSRARDTSAAADLGLFALSAAAGLVVGLATMAVFLPLAPVGVIAGGLARRRSLAKGAPGVAG